MKRLRILLVFGFFFAPLLGMGQEDSTQNAIKQKSWGINWVYCPPSRFFGGSGFSAFYQTDHNEFEVGVLSAFYNNSYFIKYGYYPNEWRKRFDLKAEILSGFSQFSDEYRRYNTCQLAVGYGMRFKVLRQLYISHSGMIGMGYSGFLNTYPFNGFNYPFQKRTFRYVEFQFRMSLNIGGFRWRKE